MPKHGSEYLGRDREREFIASTNVFANVFGLRGERYKWAISAMGLARGMHVLAMLSIERKEF